MASVTSAIYAGRRQKPVNAPGIDVRRRCGMNTSGTPNALAAAVEGILNAVFVTYCYFLNTAIIIYDMLFAVGAQCTEKSAWRIHDGTG